MNSDIDTLEQIAEQRSRSRVNYSVSPGLLRARVAREKPVPSPIVRAAPVIGAPADVDAGAAGLAFIENYDDLHRALRLRADELQLSRRTIDDLAELAGGLTEKILGPSQRRKLGMKSFGAILGALGVRLVMVENPAACETLQQKAPAKRVECQVRHQAEPSRQTVSMERAST